MRGVIAIGLVALSLDSCVGDPRRSGLDFLIGQPIDVVIGRFAPYMPEKSTSSGSYATYTWFKPVPAFYWTLNGDAGTTMTTPRCTFALRVDSRGIIKSWHWSSNHEGGCEDLLKTLRAPGP